MKKKIFFLVIVSSLSHGLIAQSNFVDSMIEWANNHHTIDSQYILTLHRISYRGIDKDLKRSFAYYEKVSYYSDSLHFIFGKGLAQINLGILFSKASNFDLSNQAYFKAIEYAESCGSLRLEAVSMNNVGDNFKTLKDFVKCRQYAREAIDINAKIKSWRGVAINYELLQQCDIAEKQYDSAKNNLDAGMKYAILNADPTVLNLFYVGYGILQSVAGNKDSAIFYFNKSIASAKAIGDLENEYHAYISEVQYLKSIQPDEKLGLLKKAMEIARFTGDLDRIAGAAHQMSFLYDEKNNRDSAAAYYKIYRTAADSLFSENNRRSVVIKETEWMLKRKEIENAHLKEVAVLQNKEIAIKNGLLLAVLISLLLLITIAVVIYKSIESKKRNTESLLKQNIAETQMQVLRSQMNPHFIFNSLNSIDAFIQSNDKYNATIYLNKFAKLVRNVLDGSKQNTITFSKDIETLKLYIELEEQRSENKFTTTLNIDKELMQGDYKVPPLIIQPFVENAILHGIRNKDSNDGLLTINISKTDSNIVYSITDNGIGRASSQKMNNHKHQKSYGIEMTYERVKLFNKETAASVMITDLYKNNRPEGTNVRVNLIII